VELIIAQGARLHASRILETRILATGLKCSSDPFRSRRKLCWYKGFRKSSERARAVPWWLSPHATPTETNHVIHP